jgi:hypothetical protein
MSVYVAEEFAASVFIAEDGASMAEYTAPHLTP